MPAGLIIFLLAAGAIALFFVGFSLSLIFRGRHPDTEIGTNPAMRKHGITCTARQFRNEEAANRGQHNPTVEECAACGIADCGLNPERPRLPTFQEPLFPS